MDFGRNGGSAAQPSGKDMNDIVEKPFDGVCDFPGCRQDATEELLSGPKEGMEFCAKHVEAALQQPYPPFPRSTED